MKEEPVQISELNNPILEFCFNRRAEIKTEQDALSTETDTINATVKAILASLDLKTVVSPVGSYTYSHTSRSSFDKAKMKQGLLKKGVTAEVVKECMEAATSIKEYDSVTFRVPEEKKDVAG